MNFVFSALINVNRLIFDIFSGVPKSGFVSFLHLNRRLRVEYPKKMAWSSEKSEISVENKVGLVRPATEANAEEAIEALKNGKVIAVPTDTLYGFACDAWYVILVDFPSFILLDYHKKIWFCFFY